MEEIFSLFLSNPFPFNGQSYLKQKGPRTSDHSLFRLQNKFRKIPLLIIYYLTKFLWYNVKWFLSYSKNYICKFTQANSWHHKLFHFHLSFWVWKVWKEMEKLQKFEYLRNKKLQNLMKKTDTSFKIITWEKNISRRYYFYTVITTMEL